MNKSFLIILLIFLLLPFTSAISNLQVPTQIRLGENLTVAGNFSQGNTLCKFMVYDSNNQIVERLSDEYTFSDGSFYSQRQVLEPPYFRGDDFNITVTCGSESDSRLFSVVQRLTIAHPIQKEWEYIFDSSNLGALSVLTTFVLLIALFILGIAWAKKRGGG